MRIFLHELRQHRKTLLIWTAVTAGMNFIFMMIYPQMADQVAGMTEVYANLGGFSAAFGMDRIDIATAMGFYGIEAGAVLSIGGGMLAAVLGGGMLCREEGGHTAEFLFSMPVSRTWVILWKTAAAFAMVCFFNVICMIVGIGAFAAAGENVEWGNFLLYHFAQLCMQEEIMLVCLGISAFLRKMSMGLFIGVALCLYFLQMFINLTDGADWLRYVTPYYYSDAARIFSAGSVEWGLALLGLCCGGAVLAAGIGKYGRKDLAA